MIFKIYKKNNHGMEFYEVFVFDQDKKFLRSFTAMSMQYAQTLAVKYINKITMANSK